MLTRLENICWYLGSGAATVSILITSGAPYAQRSNDRQWMLIAAFLLSCYMSILVHDALVKSHEPDDADQEEREKLQ